MTSIFGTIEIQQITGGNVNFGYTGTVSPKNAVKDPSGGGSKNQGGLVFTSTGISVVNYIDPDCSDQQLDTDINSNRTGTSGSTGSFGSFARSGTTGTTGSTGTTTSG